MRTPTGGTRQPGTTTGGETETDRVDFIPGQDGNLSWNTTRAIKDRPILLYVYDGHVYEGKGYDYSKLVEGDFFADKEIKKLARSFVCEKICLADHEFLRKVEGREPIHTFLKKNLADPKKRGAQLLMLDSSGKLIDSYVEKKLLRRGPKAFKKALESAQKINVKRAEEAAKKAKAG